MSESGPLPNQSSDANAMAEPEIIEVFPEMQHTDTPSIRLPKVIDGQAMKDPSDAFQNTDPESVAEITSRAWAQAARKCSANSKKYFSKPVGKRGGSGAIAVRLLEPRGATNTGDGRHGNKTVSGDSQTYVDAVYKHMYGFERTSDDENDKENARCSRCKEEKGPFKLYVTLDDISHGCSNCHYTGNNPRCSINPNRHERQPLVAVKAEVIQDIQQTLDQIAERLAEVEKSLRRVDPFHGRKRSSSDIN